MVLGHCETQLQTLLIKAGAVILFQCVFRLRHRSVMPSCNYSRVFAAWGWQMRFLRLKLWVRGRFFEGMKRDQLAQYS